MSDPFLAEIRIVSFNFAPKGWVFANGQTLPIQQYTAVFSLMGTLYGGNGTSNFQLPNLQSRVPLGFGSGAGLSTYSIGQTGGVETVSITNSNMPSHTHVISGGVTVATSVATYSKVGDQPSPSGNVLAKGKAATTPPAINDNYSDQTPDGTLGGVTSTVTSTLTAGLTGNSLPLSIVQPYIAISYVIALTGIFPSRN